MRRSSTWFAAILWIAPVMAHAVPSVLLRDNLVEKSNGNNVSISIDAARGEFVSFIATISSTTGDTISEVLVPTPPTGITPYYYQLSDVTTTAKSQVDSLPLGSYPDPLIPFPIDEVEGQSTNVLPKTLAPNGSMNVLVDIFVARSAVPGTYNLVLSTSYSGGGSPVTRSVRLIVHSAQIPAKSTLKNIFAFGNVDGVCREALSSKAACTNPGGTCSNPAETCVQSSDAPSGNGECMVSGCSADPVDSAAIKTWNKRFIKLMLNHRISLGFIDQPSTTPTAAEECGSQGFVTNYGAYIDGTASLRLPGSGFSQLRYPWRHLGTQTQCANNFYDCDGQPANGCESSVPCLAVDNFREWVAFASGAGVGTQCSASGRDWFNKTVVWSSQLGFDEPHLGADRWNKMAIYASTTDPNGLHTVDARFRTLITTSIDELDARNLRSVSDVISPLLQYMHDKPGHTAYPTVNFTMGRDYTDSRTDGNRGDYTSSGKEVWMYETCDSHDCGGLGTDSYIKGWPSSMIDDRGIQNLATPWLAYKYNASGFFYYEVAGVWGDTKGLTSPHPFSANLYDFTGNGDGTLTYIGVSSEIFASSSSKPVPLPSLRLKLIRDGLEDYELLRICEKNSPATAKSIVDSVFPFMWNNNIGGANDPTSTYLSKRSELLRCADYTPLPMTIINPGVPSPILTGIVTF